MVEGGGGGEDCVKIQTKQRKGIVNENKKKHARADGRGGGGERVGGGGLGT